MMALGASASQYCKRSRPRLARSNRARGMAAASSRQRYYPPPADTRCSARHPLTSCVDQWKLVPSRHRRCRMTASLRAIATFALCGAVPLGQTHAPRLHRRPRRPVSAARWRLEQVAAHEPIAALGDASRVVYVARLAAPRGQAKVGTDTGRAPEALRIIHRRQERSGRHGANPRHGHQSAAGLVGLGEPQHAPVQGDELLARRPPDFEQPGADCRRSVGGHGLRTFRLPPSPSTKPKVWKLRRGIWLATSRCMATSPARAASSVRMRWLSRLLTCTWRYQPVRTIWASPSASLASVLLSRNDRILCG